MQNCHEDHDIVELDTKIDFRCDCGNGNMPNTCSLNDDKDYENERNQYDLTFYDCFCSCRQKRSGEMI